MKRSCFKYIPAHLGRIFNFRIYLALTLIAASSAFCGTKITGTVTDEKGRPVSDVNVSVNNTSYGTVTDSFGRFTLSNLPTGTYDILFGHVCCELETVNISTGGSGEIKLNVVLDEKEIELEPVRAFAAADQRPDIVLSSKDIERTGASGLPQILQGTPGIKVEETGGTGSRISVRGTDTRHTAVLLDGIVLNSVLDGSCDLSSLPVSMVEKIEIYKSGGALTGRSAGGVISITTKKGSGPGGAEFYYNNSLYQSDRDIFSAGRLDNHAFGVSLKRAAGGLGCFVSYAGERSSNRWTYINAAKADEYRYINYPNTPKEQTNAYTDSDNLFLSFKYSAGKLDADAGLAINRKERGLPGWYDQPYYEAYSQQRSLMFSSNSAFRSTANLTTTLSASFIVTGVKTVIEEENISPFFQTNTDDIFGSSALKLKASYESRYIELKSDVAYSNEYADSPNLSSDDESRSVTSFCAGAVFSRSFEKYPELNISGSLRRDLITGSDFDRFLFSGSAYTRFDKGKLSVSPSFSYSQTYSLPTFADMFWAENLFSSGNPDLEPEYCVQHEAGVRTAFESGQGTLKFGYSYYNKELEDLIIWIKRNDGKYVPENFKRGRITGHELSLSAELGEIFSLTAGYENMDARQFTDDPATDGKAVIYKPAESLSLRADAGKNGWKFGAEAVYTGKTFLNETNSFDIYPFWLFGAEISKKIKSGMTELEMSVSADNLLDEQYQVIYGYPMPGRKITSGIKIKF